jgi:hypothetical protein
MSSPNHKSVAGAIHAPAQDAENGRHNHGGNEPVETIHKTAMAGDEMARILDAETPFDR